MKRLLIILSLLFFLFHFSSFLLHTSYAQRGKINVLEYGGTPYWASELEFSEDVTVTRQGSTRRFLINVGDPNTGGSAIAGGWIYDDANQTIGLFDPNTVVTVTDIIGTSSVEIGGGYGSTGLTISSDGNLFTDGNIIVDSVATFNDDVFMGTFHTGNNPGVVSVFNCSVDSNSVDGTEEGYTINVDGTEIFRVSAESDGTGGVDTPKVKIPNNNGLTIGDGTASDKDIITVDEGTDETAELMPNLVDQDFSGASAWTNVDLNAYNETGDLTITATAADQYCTLLVASAPTTIDLNYKMTFDVANIVSTWTVKSFDGTQIIGTVTADGIGQSLEWVATTTGGYRIVAVANDSNADFDNFTLSAVKPNIRWDESDSEIVSNVNWAFPSSSIRVGTVEISDNNGCLFTNEFHAEGSGGVSGYLKIKHGTDPSIHKEGDHSIVWINPNGKVYLENESGVDYPMSVLDVDGRLQLEQTTVPGVATDKMYNVDGALFWNGTDISTPDPTTPLEYLFIEDQTNDGFSDDEIVPFSTTPSILVGGTFASNQYTVGQDGRFEVLSILSLLNQSDQADDSFIFRIRKNAVTIAGQQVDPMSYAGDNEETQIMIAGIFDFDSGDVIDLYLYDVDDTQSYTSRQLLIKQLPSSLNVPIGGNIEIGSENSIYFGDPNINGTWKIERDGTTLSFYRRVSDAYVRKGYFDDSFHADEVIATSKIYVGSVELTDEGGQLRVDGGDVEADSMEIFNQSTGLIRGGIITINAGDGTLIDVSAIEGQIVDSTTDPNNPTLVPISCAAKIGIDLVTMPDPNDTIAIYLAMDEDENIIERLALPTPEQLRDTIDLGIAARIDNGIIVFAGSASMNIVQNLGSQVHDLINALGPFNISGNKIQPYGTGLQIEKTAGLVFRNGANFYLDPKDPHRKFLDEQIPVDPFNYKLSDGTDITLSATQLDPDHYDDGSSVPATVPNNKWSVQRIALFASGVIEILPGQEIYADEDEAINALPNIDFVIPIDSAEAIPLSYVILQQSDTVVSEDRFYPISRGGSGGGNGVSYWSRSGTELSPKNAGDSVILATQTELSSDPNFTTDPGWTIYSGSNTWTWDAGNSRMLPIGEEAGDTIADTGVSLVSGTTYVISLSWFKFIGQGYLQIYLNPNGSQRSDYINDGTHENLKWIFTATANENIFIRSTGSFHSDGDLNYISRLSVVEINDLGDVISGRLVLGGLTPESYEQIDSYTDTALFFPSDKDVLTVNNFEMRNINAGGIDFDETYGRIILGAYDISLAFGSSGYEATSLRGNSDVSIRTYEAGGTITLNELSLDTDLVLNGDSAVAYKHDAGDGRHTFTGKIQVGLSIYANNAAAISGGLTVGELYRTGSDPSVVCVVY